MTRLFMLLAFVWILSSCNPSGKSYILNGSIEGLSTGIVYLQQRIDKEYVSVDSVLSGDGTFTFEGSVSIPDVYYIAVNGQRSLVMLENSTITFTAHIDSLRTPEITGSDANDEYKAYSDAVDNIYNKVKALFQEYRTAEMNGDTAMARELGEQGDNAYQSIAKYREQYLDEHPSSYISPLVVQELHYGKEAEEIEALLDKLDSSLDTSVVVGNLKRRVEVLKKVSVGSIAPDFTQSDPDGNPVSLASLRGKYLLIDFWAAWCGPCRRENPNVVEAYRKYKEKGFDILGVSLDQSRDRWLEAIQADGLTWTQVSDVKGWDNEAAAIYGISSIPSNLLLDPEGKIIAKNLRGEDLHNELEKLLNP